MRFGNGRARDGSRLPELATGGLYMLTTIRDGGASRSAPKFSQVFFYSVHLPRCTIAAI
jgi:hypothetical protein